MSSGKLPPQPSQSSATPTDASTQHFHELLKVMLTFSNKVSDLIFSPGRPPQVELMGELKPVTVKGLEKLLPHHTSSIAKLIIGQNETALTNLERSGSADVSYGISGVARFRVNVFRQRGTVAIVMRVIPNSVPTLQDLSLPPQLAKVAELRNGIVLVTGPTGSGKSSTLAAIIDLINNQYAYHIITIEDPIEFIHPHKKATIHQRELYADTDNFANALRAALRQAPKVILVGEMRDRETVEVALEASETGHLVLSTLHTTDASKTVDRIIGIFPKSEEHVIRMRLASSFQYIISQRLIPRADGRGRVPAVEILRTTMRTREYMERGDSADGKSLVDAMKQGEIDGMQDFDTVLERMIKQGVISMNDGLSYATNRHNLQLQLSDVGSGSAHTTPPSAAPPRPPAGPASGSRPAPAPTNAPKPGQGPGGGGSIFEKY